MKLSAFQWSIIALGTALYVINLWALARRRLWRHLPFLAAYLLIVFLRDRIYLSGLYFWPVRTAAWFYWIGEGVIYVASFLLIVSLWRWALGTLRGVWTITKWILPVALVALLAFARWSSGFTPGASPAPGDWASDWLRFMGQTLSLMQAVLLLGLLLVVTLFSLPVAPLVRRVAACWFVYSLLKVGLLSLRIVLGPGFNAWYDYASSAAFITLLSVWAALLARAQVSDLRTPQPVFVLEGGPSGLAGRLVAVNESLTRVLKV